MYDKPPYLANSPPLTPETHSDLTEFEIRIQNLSQSSSHVGQSFSHLAEATARLGSIIHDETQTIASESCVIENLSKSLRRLGIQVHRPHEQPVPPAVAMHDRAAAIPTAIISPRSEWGVKRTMEELTSLDVYSRHRVSIRSGGHGYANQGSCSDVMINLAALSNQRVENDVLFLGPGCILGHVLLTLARHQKAVPHGDCFGVGAGGHFLTAGWDMALARRYGLGCQSIAGGRLVLWNGDVLDVDAQSHPKLLYAMRGGAAAEAGVVTELRLKLIPEPPLVVWCFQKLYMPQLRLAVSRQAFKNATKLPKDVTISFRFHFELGELDPVCSLSVVSLLRREDTLKCIDKHLGQDITALVAVRAYWHAKTLLDFRMVPASVRLASDPQSLSEATAITLHEDPYIYWNPQVTLREMARSYFTSISNWVSPDCDSMFLDLYEAFQTVQSPSARQKMYALVVQGGGAITELQDQCSMPLGQALARFEMHWDLKDEEEYARMFTDQIACLMELRKDQGPSRPYRGDIWLAEQGRDPVLDEIRHEYNGSVSRCDRGASSDA